MTMDKDEEPKAPLSRIILAQPQFSSQCALAHGVAADFQSAFLFRLSLFLSSLSISVPEFWSEIQRTTMCVGLIKRRKENRRKGDSGRNI